MIKGPTLPRATAVSFLLHVGFFLFMLLGIRQRQLPLPEIYNVTLVPPAAVKAEKAPAQAETPPPEETQPEETTPPPVTKPETGPVHTVEKTTEKTEAVPVQKTPSIKPATADEREHVEDKIALLRGKRKVASLVRSRKSITLTKQYAPVSAVSPPSSKVAENKSLTTNYYIQQLEAAVWQAWIYPGRGGENFEAIIVVTIQKDGIVRIDGFEQSSGNKLFDISAERALKKILPITPPPKEEIEVGIRFHP